jgi:DNA polymerase I
MLGENKLDVSYAEIPKLWSSDVHRLIEYARMDAILTLRLVLEKRMIDHYIELSRLSGVLLHDVFGGQTIRIETAVLHEFKRRNMLMPTKKSAEAEAIKGAVVLEPVVGLHKNVLVLDFASLYPSIIKNFNISPDTLVFDKNENTHVAPNGTRFLNKEIYEGVFPAIISRLLEERWAAKAAMASATGEERRILNVKQYAIKILCNSFYGYAGYNRARLYVSDVANAITAYGRENIKRTKELVEKQFGVRVLYADTDSLFIESKLDDLDSIYDLGKRISEYVSTQTGLQFEFEKIYKTFLILTKKRYAGLIIKRTKDGNWEDGGIDMRGIETVRRDWCEFVTETMQGVLETILRNNDIEGAVANVKQAIAQIKNGTVPLEKLTIVKGLTKAIGSYDGLLPHVQLARKLTARNPSAAPRVGERIGYVIVRGTGKLSERAEDPAYVKENNLALDVDYYINSQLLPPIERIFAALGVKKAELLGTGRQTNLFDLETREFFCTSCGRAWRRLPLRGLCDCGGKLANS